MWPVWTKRPSPTRVRIVLALFGAGLGCGKDTVSDTRDTAAPVALDADQDGVIAEEDCDDNDPSLGAQANDEDCDGLLTAEDCDDRDASSSSRAEDADCDGSQSEEDCDDADPTLNTLDRDEDGVSSCEGDCDDEAFFIHPNAHDGLLADRNCDGEVEWEGYLGASDAKITGRAAGDYAGITVESAGDVNGDGLMDFLIAAPYEDESGMGSGAVYVFFGRTDRLPNSLTVDDADVRLLGENEADNAGTALAGVGDVDGDGLDDILIGARYQAEGGPYAGAAYLVYGSELVQGSSQGLGDLGVKFVGERFHDNAGASVASAGDVDGDGLADLLIGSYRNDTQAEDAGAVYVFLASSLGSSSVVDVSSADFILLGENQDDNAGFSLAGAGDVDGDGLHDLLVGARYSATGGLYAGAVYVVLGAQLTDPGPVALADATCKLIGEEVSDYAGLSVASAGDLDGDGRSDVLVGAPGQDRGAVDSGAVYGVWSTQLVNCGQRDLSDAAFVLYGEAEGDGVGGSIESIPDLTGDGVRELLVGVARQDASADEAGAVYLVSGEDLREGGEISLSSAVHRWLGEVENDGAGLSVAAAGDLDSDGSQELIIGASGDDSFGENSGSVYVISDR